jgi:hypothetical protein
MGTGGSFPGVKRGRGVMLATHSHLVSRSRMSGSYTSSPPGELMTCSGSALASYINTRLDTLVSVMKNDLTTHIMWIIMLDDKRDTLKQLK